MTRAVMWTLLGIVAASAAVLSFSALKDLADLCGFHPKLSPLLPLVVDAGAAAGCLVWLSPKDVTKEARRFARALTWVLLASSVAGNAIVHGLSAYGLRPHWTLVVAVSAIAPGVLGAIVHLSVLVGRVQHVVQLDVQEPAPVAAPPETRTVPPIPASVGVSPPATKPSMVGQSTDSLVSRTRELLPIGHVKLARELQVGEYRAKQLLKQAKAEAPRNGVKVLEDAR